MWRRFAGFWGPLAFGVASVVAARRQPNYSHRADHVSGLASQGEPSAVVMVPGFVALAAAQWVQPAPTPTLRRLVRTAAITSLLAGVVRVSAPHCPRPGVDPEATAADLGHGAASVATFVLWSALPVVASGETEVSGWYRRAARLAIPVTLAAFVIAGATTASGSGSRGLTQRVFLGTAFVFLAATGMAGPPQAAAGRRPTTS